MLYAGVSLTTPALFFNTGVSKSIASIKSITPALFALSWHKRK
jgi:hypothetical protein